MREAPRLGAPTEPGSKRDPAEAGRCRWRWLGRALPKRIRERLFEPAYDDLLYRSLRPGKARAQRSVGLGAVLLLIESLRVGLPREAVLRLRAIRPRRVAVVGLLCLGALLSLALFVRLYLPRY